MSSIDSGSGPTLRLAKSLKDVPHFLYQLSHYKKGIDVGGELATVDEKDETHWASHGADIPFVFGNTVGPDLYWNTKIQVPFTPEEERLSAYVRSAFVNFAATGHPGNDFDAGVVLDLETDALGGVTRRPDFKRAECAFWDAAAAL